MSPLLRMNGCGFLFGFGLVSRCGELGSSVVDTPTIRREDSEQSVADKSLTNERQKGANRRKYIMDSTRNNISVSQ